MCLLRRFISPWLNATVVLNYCFAARLKRLSKDSTVIQCTPATSKQNLGEQLSTTVWMSWPVNHQIDTPSVPASDLPGGMGQTPATKSLQRLLCCCLRKPLVKDAAFLF